MAPGRVRSGFCSDRISDLPCHLKEHILSYLPLRDAARTSILASHWRHTWLAIPNVVFNASMSTNLDLESIVYNVLIRHRGPIVKFRFGDFKPVKYVTIDNWFLLLSDHLRRLEHLQLDFYAPESFYPIPQCVFRCQHLRSLLLTNVKVRIPSDFKGFGRLVTLRLRNVGNVIEVVKAFTHKCPKLGWLSVSWGRDNAPLCLHITAPNLKTFYCNLPFRSIYLETPSLEDISLENSASGSQEKEGLFDIFERYRSSGNTSNLIKFFNQVPSIRRVFLGRSFMRFLALGGLPQRLPNSLDNLTHLTAGGICLERTDDIAIIVCLIKSSPNLSRLRILLDLRLGYELTSVQYLKAQWKCKDPLSRSLKNVDIVQFQLSEAHTEFAKLLLSRDTALEGLRIVAISKARNGMKYNYKMVVGQLATVPRASPDAIVVFNQVGENVLMF